MANETAVPRGQRYALCRATATGEGQSMGQFDPILEINPRAADEFRAALKEVRRYMQFDLLQLVYLNLLGHVEVLEDMRRTASDPLGFVRSRSTVTTHWVLASLFNFCSSLHGLQEHSEARARRRGEDELASKVHSLFSDAYDAGDELFFARKLRDAMVHSSLEVFDYNTSFLIEVENEPPVARSETYFVRSALLGQQRTFNSRLRTWIERQDEKFAILPVLQQAFSQLENMYAEVVGLLYPELAVHCEAIVSICDAIGEMVDDRDNLLIYPATADLSPDAANHHLMFVVYPEVVAYAFAALDDSSPGPRTV